MRIRDRISPSARRSIRSAVAVAIVATACATAAFAFTAAAVVRRDIGPLEVVVRIEPAIDGQTVLELPPFGSVRANTHAGPASVTLAITSVDLKVLEDIVRLGVPSQEQALAWGDALVAMVWEAVVRGTVAALAAGVLIALALRRSWRIALVTGVLVLVVLGGAIGMGAATLDTDAFLEPHFDGALAYAPAAFGIVQQRYDDVETMQDQIGALARNLVAYYGVPQSFTGAGTLEGTIRVLHVSDLHLDPIGMQLMLELAESYRVDLIIDTGDITHFGTAQEAELAAAQIGDTPYVFVPGNHDSPAVRDALAAGGVTVLDGETTETASGLVVFGVGDPAGVEWDIQPDTARATARGEQALGREQERWDAGGEVPHIVAVHQAATGKAFVGHVQLVLSGHSHKIALKETDGTVLLGAGTTGGVHFTELRSDPHIPHSAAILYFSAEEPGTLLAIDQIEVTGTTRQSAIRRTVYEPVGP